MPQAVTTVTGEVFNHRILWKTAVVLKEQALAAPERGFWFRLPAMLVARLTVEAHANFIIAVLDLDMFTREKEEFGSSTVEKHRWIASRAGIRLVLGKRPYQTVAQLQDLRDAVVHAKPEVYMGQYRHAVDEDPPGMEPGEIERLANPENFFRAMDDVQEFVEWLHRQVLSVADAEQKRRLQPFALTGTTQMRIRSTDIGET